MKLSYPELLKSLGPFTKSDAGIIAFSLKLEKEWRRRITESVDYLGENPDFLRLDFDTHLRGLDILLAMLESQEEYERCQAVQALREELSKEMLLLLEAAARDC